MVVFSNVLTIFSTKTLAQSVSNSYNHIKEEQMLWLDVGFQNFVNDIKLILVFMILKAKEYSLGTLWLCYLVKQMDLCVHIHKNHYCVIWKKNRRDSLLNGLEKKGGISNMLKRI